MNPLATVEQWLIKRTSKHRSQERLLVGFPVNQVVEKDTVVLLWYSLDETAIKSKFWVLIMNMVFLSLK